MTKAEALPLAHAVVERCYGRSDLLPGEIAAAILDAERRGYEQARKAAENAIIESPMRDHERRLLRQKIRALREHTDGK